MTEPSTMLPIPLLLWCPKCGARHIDTGAFAEKHHHTHACQTCGLVWRPAIVPTVGVAFLPGFKNMDPPAPAASSAAVDNSDIVMPCEECEKPTSESLGARSVFTNEQGKLQFLCWDCRLGK